MILDRIELLSLNLLHKDNLVSLPRVLFILKYRDNADNSYSCGGLSSGLYNSAIFVCDMLNHLGFTAEVVQVTDNNDIDREVTKFRPDYVIIEALWVVPEKFDVLCKLHPTVRWVIRCHSEIPFLSNEGIAVDWLIRYLENPNVDISGNSEAACWDLRLMIRRAYRHWPLERHDHRVVYLPNYYPIENLGKVALKRSDSYLDVGCFGAIRPMKNQLLQAVASVDVAAKLQKKLRFHVNATRVEQGGSNTLKNLQALLSRTGGELVEHPWTPHTEFLSVLTGMDIGLQVSFSETFNIVAADMVSVGLPIVVSPEVSWATVWSQADTTDSTDISRCMLRALDWKWKNILKAMNESSLKAFVRESKEHWMKYLDRRRH